MEEFVPGAVTTYDGVCNSRGEVLFAASHISPDSIMDMVNEGAPCCYYVDKQIPPEVEKAGKAVLAAFGATRRFFHLEFFRLTADQGRPGPERRHRGSGGEYAARRRIYPRHAQFQPKRGRIPNLGRYGGL